MKSSIDISINICTKKSAHESTNFSALQAENYISSNVSNYGAINTLSAVLATPGRLYFPIDYDEIAEVPTSRRSCMATQFNSESSSA